MDEKAERRKFLKAAVMLVAVVACVITHSAVWGCVHDGSLEKSYTAFSLINLCVEGWGLALIYKRLFK